MWICEFVNLWICESVNLYFFELLMQLKMNVHHLFKILTDVAHRTLLSAWFPNFCVKHTAMSVDCLAQGQSNLRRFFILLSPISTSIFTQGSCTSYLFLDRIQLQYLVIHHNTIQVIIIWTFLFLNYWIQNCWLQWFSQTMINT